MNLLRILIKACIFMIFIIPKFNVVVQHSTLVNRLPSSTSILTSTVFSIPCWSPASYQHPMLVTSIPPASHAGHQHPTSIPYWSPASHQHSMLVTSIPPAFHAGHQHPILVTSIPPAFHAGHQHTTSIPCWSPASHQHPILVTSIPPAFHAGHQHTSTKTQHMLVLLVTSYAGLCWFFQQGGQLQTVSLTIMFDQFSLLKSPLD